MGDLRIFVEPKAPPTLTGALTFETGATHDQVCDPAAWAYEHHGTSFGQANPGALTCLFEDLVLARPMPESFVTHRVSDIDTIVAMALFLYRDLTTHPVTPSLVVQTDLVHRRGLAAMAHVDSDLALFFRLLRGYFPDGLARQEQNERICTAVGWVREYLVEGKLPSLGSRFPVPRVLDTGPGGFVVAESGGSLPEAWFELYRQGYTRGVCFGPRIGTQLPALLARKSPFVPLDLRRACARLNEVELTLGGSPLWKLEGEWLWSPPQGSLILAVDIVGYAIGFEVPFVEALSRE